MTGRVLRMGWALLLVALVMVIPARAQDADATVRPDILNMRHGPGSQYATVASLPRGTALTLIAQDDQPGGGIWLYARTPDGTEGWVLSDYLIIRADLDITALPTQPAPGDLGTPVETPPQADAPAQPDPGSGVRAGGVRLPGDGVRGCELPHRAGHQLRDDQHDHRRHARPGDRAQRCDGLGDGAHWRAGRLGLLRLH